jgi:hypothetical protein
MNRVITVGNSRMWFPGAYTNNEYAWYRPGQVVFYDDGTTIKKVKIEKLDKCFHWAMRNSNNYEGRRIADYAVYVERLTNYLFGNGISLICEGIGLSKADLEKQRLRDKTPICKSPIKFRSHFSYRYNK